MQLQNFGEFIETKKPNFEDILPADQEQMHYSKFESLIQDYFEIDGLSSNVIVSYLLHKNHSFTLIKID